MKTINNDKKEFMTTHTWQKKRQKKLLNYFHLFTPSLDANLFQFRDTRHGRLEPQSFCTQLANSGHCCVQSTNGRSPYVRGLDCGWSSIRLHQTLRLPGWSGSSAAHKSPYQTLPLSANHEGCSSSGTSWLDTSDICWPMVEWEWWKRNDNVIGRP